MRLIPGASAFISVINCLLCNPITFNAKASDSTMAKLLEYPIKILSCFVIGIPGPLIQLRKRLSLPSDY